MAMWYFVELNPAVDLQKVGLLVPTDHLLPERIHLYLTKDNCLVVQL